MNTLDFVELLVKNQQKKKERNTLILLIIGIFQLKEMKG
jgi:hypothetical protein